MTRILRLREDVAAGGIHNMAQDRAMLVAAEHGDASIRLYGWEDHWVSLGANQERIEGIRQQIHRPTGGRAVLHGDDITLAVAIPLALLGSSHFELRSIYGRLMAPLFEALAACGLSVRQGFESELGGRHRSLDCFATTGRFDLCLEGSNLKVGGAALYTSKSAALLQVSILIRNSVGLGPFPPRQVIPWRSCDLSHELRIAWQSRGWRVEPSGLEPISES